MLSKEGPASVSVVVFTYGMRHHADMLACIFHMSLFEYAYLMLTAIYYFW